MYMGKGAEAGGGEGRWLLGCGCLRQCVGQLARPLKQEGTRDADGSYEKPRGQINAGVSEQHPRAHETGYYPVGGLRGGGGLMGPTT